ncbi:hypothetical protein LPJ76_005626 [Coemansia sp. RSA 638]|nr:hypothetical protein LPJ76_005626 [Coemansia sp. RSA 638]
MPSPAIVDRIDRYFLSASADTAGWEVSVAYRMLQCFRGLAIGLDPSALHRRWVSEEIEAETTANTNSTTNLGVPGSFHARNCSDSRIQATGPHGAPLLRKSALSLHRTSQGTLQADAAERAKQVRFQPSLPEDPQVDQARLNELAQLLAQFDAAIELLAVVVQDRQRTNRSDTDSTQTAKGLVTAFVQISRLSSTSGLVKHYDKATLAQFKTTTMAVKRLMAHP